MNNNSMNYIVSGCSYSRMTFPESTEDPSCLEFICDCFKKLQTVGKNHKFSLLYNAYAEKNYGKGFQHYRDSVAEIITDSGGLQIVTQGKVITDEIKDQVYKNQGTWSDTGLSFDEIPLQFEGETSSRLDLSNRWFDRDRFEWCAKQTGRNVAKQIETFLEMDSDTKPIFITQGNCYDTYMQWTELALKEIPKQWHQYIEGVAMGATALGHGTLEDIKRAFFFTQLPIDTNRLHLLAVGSVNRLIPNIIFSQNGLYNDLEISYDSTTHSSGTSMGRIYLNEKTFNFPIQWDEAIHTFLWKTLQESDYAYKIDLPTFFEILDTPSGVFKEKHGSRVPYIKTYISLLTFTISEFIKHAEACFDSKKKVLKSARNNKIRGIYSSLYGIRTMDDYNSWERSVARHVKSRPVASKKKQQSQLEDLF